MKLHILAKKVTSLPHYKGQVQEPRGVQSIALTDNDEEVWIEINRSGPKITLSVVANGVVILPPEKHELTVYQLKTLKHALAWLAYELMTDTEWASLQLSKAPIPATKVCDECNREYTLGVKEKENERD